MDERRTVRVSKYLSKHLRHQPERIGLTLDEGGWIGIDTLIEAAAAHNFPFTRAELDHVVAANDKQRFAVQGDRFPPSQGNTVDMDLGLPPAPPPPTPNQGTFPTPP
ncbi:RNA 2'-phosphotransferase, partial [Streptomyces sp. ND04-05B]|uniref:RNA 2'-phosphotransferase n=1 Tax=Streptomyces sp. ND04-05B TaxID=3028693 RepID=UPI0029B45CD9